MKYELSFHNHKAGLEVAMALIQENYVVLISTEEDLLILNYEWTPEGRNGVIFMEKSEFEEKFC